MKMLTTLELFFVIFVSVVVDDVRMGFGTQAMRPMYPDHMQLSLFLCVTIIGLRALLSNRAAVYNCRKLYFRSQEVLL